LTSKGQRSRSWPNQLRQRCRRIDDSIPV